MRERDASHRVTRANQLWTLFLLCIDAIQVWCTGGVVRGRVSVAVPVSYCGPSHERLPTQVVVLCLNPAFGWSASLLKWMSDFSLLELLLPDRDPGALFVMCMSYLLAV